MSTERVFRHAPSGLQLRPGLLLVLVAVVGCLAGMLVLGLASPAKLAILVIGLAVLVAMTIRIDLGLAVFAFVIYAGFPDALPKHFSLPAFVWPMIAFFAGAGLLRRIFSPEHNPGWVRPMLLATLYVVVCATSLVTADKMVKTQEALANLFQSAAIAMTIVFLTESAGGFRMAMLALVGVGIFLGSLSIHQYLTGNFFSDYWGFARSEIRQIAGETHKYRLTGPLGDANFFSQIMLVILPISAERFMSERKWYIRAAAAAAFALSALSVIFAYSRGAFLAVLFMLFLVLLRFRLRAKHWALLVLAGVLFLAVVPNEYTERMKSLIGAVPGGHQYQSDRSFSGRKSEYVSAIRMFADHPLFGVGYGNFPLYYQKYSRQAGLDAYLSNRSAHSLYLQIAAETGLVGLFAFGLLIWVIMRGIKTSIRAFQEMGRNHAASMLSGLYLGLIGYLFAGLFLHVAYSRYLWVLLGLALAVPRLTAHELTEMENQGIQNAN